MKCDKRHMLLYAVTNRAWSGKQTLCCQVEAALKGGVTCVQLREKELDETAFLQEARDICGLCRRYGVPFIVNDNVDIAVACGADGIHVGQEDMAAGEVRRRAGENMILGVSVHTVDEARKAVENGADYLGLGAVFPTATKTDAAQMPKEILRAGSRCSTISTLPVNLQKRRKKYSGSVRTVTKKFTFLTEYRKNNCNLCYDRDNGLETDNAA